MAKSGHTVDGIAYDFRQKKTEENKEFKDGKVQGNTVHVPVGAFGTRDTGPIWYSQLENDLAAWWRTADSAREEGYTVAVKFRQYVGWQVAWVYFWKES